MRPWLTGFLVRLKEETSDSHYPGMACIGYRLSAIGYGASSQMAKSIAANAISRLSG
jgi:hypothetical protein